ncbi:MAG: hypothetical protein ABIN69_11290, partial [Aestuariivirga sp.]
GLAIATPGFVHLVKGVYDMKWLCGLILTLLFQSAAFASGNLSGAGIAALLTDATLYGSENGQPAEQVFQKSGATFYSIPNGQSQGEWKIEGNKYCSAWPPNPTWVCYDVINDGAAVTFVSPSGKRTLMSLTK